MSFKCDADTKSEMRREKDTAKDKFKFNKFKYSNFAYKNTHQCMSRCYDTHKKPTKIWNCLRDCNRIMDNSKRYLNSIVTEFLHDPATECFDTSVGTTQSAANEQYTKCVRTQVKVFMKVRNECMA
eukprot:185393_1